MTIGEPKQVEREYVVTEAYVDLVTDAVREMGDDLEKTLLALRGGALVDGEMATSVAHLRELEFAIRQIKETVPCER